MHPLIRSKNCRGFSLIEMSVVLIVLGLLAASITPLAGLYFKARDREKTQTSIEMISSAIGNFRSLYGRYPCPASLTLPREDSGYGREKCTDMSSIPPGSCVGGFCIEESLRTITYTDPITKAPVTGKPRVRVGFIPFRQLNLDEKDAYDAYGSRIMYAVTEHLEDADSFAPDQGGIEIMNAEGRSKLGTDASAHFVVFSYGPDKAGGYSLDGGRIPCPATGIQKENCNQETSSVYDVVDENSGTSDPFDDVFSYFTQDEIPLWQLSESAGHTGDIHQKPAGQVGIFTTSSTPLLAEGDVKGTVRAQDDPLSAAAEGHSMAVKMCQTDGTDCFPSNIIAGQLAESEGMECPPGQFIQAIKYAAPVCATEITVQCPAGQFVLGINPDGTLICDGAPDTGADCPSTTVDICGMSRTLPNGSNGDIYTVEAPMVVFSSTQTYHPTIKKQQTYLCDNGTWKEIPPSSGSCSCTNGSTTTQIPCPAGYTGNQTVNAVVNCSTNTTTQAYDPSQCVCAEVTETNIIPCSTDAAGTGRTMQRSHVCPPQLDSVWHPPYWTDWEEVSNDCACDTETRNVSKSCPPNYTGEIIEEERLDCDTGEWIPTKEISNTCACTDTTQMQTTNCPEGQSGSIQEKWAFSCATGTWTFVNEVSNTCAPAVCQWTPISSPQGPYNFSTGPLQYTECTCGTSSGPCHRAVGAQFENFAVCSCQ